MINKYLQGVDIILGCISKCGKFLAVADSDHNTHIFVTNEFGLVVSQA